DGIRDLHVTGVQTCALPIFDLQIRPLADSRAGQIALQTGAVDVILSDFVWVSIQRNQDNMVSSVPHSLEVGGLMVPPDSGITTRSEERRAGKVFSSTLSGVQ